MKWLRYLPRQASVRALTILINDPVARGRLDQLVAEHEQQVAAARKHLRQVEQTTQAELKKAVSGALSEIMGTPMLSSDEVLIILNTACEVWGVNLSELMAPTRQSPRVIQCRTAVAGYLHYDRRQSMVQVSEHLNREVSTVWHLVRRAMASPDERLNELRQLLGEDT